MKSLHLKLCLWAICCAMITFSTQPCFAKSKKPVWQKTVYVPVFQTIQHNTKGGFFDLINTLYIRNTDDRTKLTILSVKRYSPNGVLIKSYLKKPIELGPLCTTNFVAQLVKRKTKDLGQCFLVKMRSNEKITQPLVQSVMIGATMSQGISFICEGRVLRESCE